MALAGNSRLAVHKQHLTTTITLSNVAPCGAEQSPKVKNISNNKSFPHSHLEDTSINIRKTERLKKERKAERARQTKKKKHMEKSVQYVGLFHLRAGGVSVCVCVCVRACARLPYLHKAAGHMLPKHGQAGPALAVHVQGVYRHDNGRPRLGRGLVRHQDVDSAVAKADGVVGRPVEGDQRSFSETWQKRMRARHDR